MSNYSSCCSLYAGQQVFFLWNCYQEGQHTDASEPPRDAGQDAAIFPPKVPVLVVVGCCPTSLGILSYFIQLFTAEFWYSTVKEIFRIKGAPVAFNSKRNLGFIDFLSLRDSPKREGVDALRPTVLCWWWSIPRNEWTKRAAPREQRVSNRRRAIWTQSLLKDCSVSPVAIHICYFTSKR